MPTSDILIVLRFWGVLFLVGTAAYPLTRRLFRNWYDRGYMFSKAVGVALVSWLVYIFGMARIAPFTESTIWVGIGSVFVFGLFASVGKGHQTHEEKAALWKTGVTICVEEVLFLSALVFWSWIKAHEPSIRGLEKFMDYGFMQSILNSTYFPPADMWYPPMPINYYYFGHLVAALLTRLSHLDLGYTFNLMLATIFACTLTMSFSIGYQLIVSSLPVGRKKTWVALLSGGLTAFLVTLSGNMQTIYAFTKGYIGEEVKPFWELFWSRGELLGSISEGIERYWYANATRFIPYAIHEFPSYSFVVSDIHGHVLSIPFVLLALALILEIFTTPRWNDNFQFSISNLQSIFQISNFKLQIIFYGFLVGVLLMTNALDGPIYFVLCMAVLAVFVFENAQVKGFSWKPFVWIPMIVGGVTVFTSLPFLSHFSSFVNGLAINCPLPFFAHTKIGPILFEGVEKCQRSPLWMMWILWGFFVYCGIAFFGMKRGSEKKYSAINTSLLWRIYDIWKTKFTHVEKVLGVFFFISILLLIFPELFYFKDIYPQHFRSNTMFKLGYQAFIMLSIVSGYAISRYVFARKFDHGEHMHKGIRRLFLILLVPQLFFVSIYPLFSVRSYFGRLARYEGLYGFTWMMQQYPDDYQAALWIKQQVSRHMVTGILVEADGDSYTDYERFSVMTGVPTPIGWAVHEWLWRGTYDVVSPRRDDVRVIYESSDMEAVRQMLKKYGVEYVIVGSLEREKFKNLHEEIFAQLGSEAFRSGNTVIYAIRD